MTNSMRMKVENTVELIELAMCNLEKIQDKALVTSVLGTQAYLAQESLDAGYELLDCAYLRYKALLK